MRNEKTIKEQFVEVAEVLAEVGRTDLVDFVNGRIEVLDRKSATKSKASAEKQAANEVIKENILKALATFDEAVDMDTLKTALKDFDEGEYTVPKIAALVKQLRDADKVERVMNGKKPTYKAVA